MYRVSPGTGWRGALIGAVLTATLLAFAASAGAHPFKWDASAKDPKRPGVTLRWDRTLSDCGDTEPFRTLKVQTHQAQTRMRSNQYLVVSGRRQLLTNGKWLSLPSSSDYAERRGRNGRSTTHATLEFYLRFVDRGRRSRVKVGYTWKQAAGEPGDAGDKVLARRTAYTRACTIP